MQNVRDKMNEGQYLPVMELSLDVRLGLVEEREKAWEVIENREALIHDGRGSEVPLSLDALSTADHAVAVKEIHGNESLEYEEAYKALFTDTHRLIAEWNRKLKPEVFGQLRHHYNQPEEEFYSHGLAVGQMTLNALVPVANSPEETDRRVNERVEHMTPYIIKNVGKFALSGVGIRTISQCTEQAIDEYESDQATAADHRGYDGYVPEVEKLMIRDIRIDPETGDRIQVQVGLVGKNSITHDVIQRALLRRGVDAAEFNKTGIHGLQLLVDDDIKDFVKLLDEVASEEWCTPIFMGERVDEGHPRDYDAFWEEAIGRQHELTDMTEKAVSFILDLAEDNFDRRKAPRHIEDFVKKLLLNKALQDVEVAYNAFGEETAQGIIEVQALQQTGQFQEALSKLQEVEGQAPGGGACSGGSCGLESVDDNTKEGISLKEALKAEEGDTIVKDKERSCKDCGQKKVSYAYSSKKVNKYCEGCGAFESKRTK